MPSSFFAKNKEKTGEVLNKVQPIPNGRFWKTVCWRNIPIFVPIITEIINLPFSFLVESSKRLCNLKLFIGNKKKIAPSNLISVVCMGIKSLSTRTSRDNKAAKTAQIIDKKAYKNFPKEILEWINLDSLSKRTVFFLIIKINEVEITIIPIHDLIDKLSLIKNPPVNAAINGDKASIDRVLRAHFIFKDFK